MPFGRSAPAPPSSTRRRICLPALSRTAIGGAPCWKAFVISSLAIRPTFCAVVESNVTLSASTATGTGAVSSILREQPLCLDGRPAVLGEQPVQRRDRVDAGGGLVEGAAVAIFGAAEQEQVGDRLQVVLDPVIRLGRRVPVRARRVP